MAIAGNIHSYQFNWNLYIDYLKKVNLINFFHNSISLNTLHRPKVEEFDNYLFLTLKLLAINKDDNSVVSEHISEVIEDLEEKVLHTPNNKSLQEIQHLKKQLINLRKAVTVSFP